MLDERTIRDAIDRLLAAAPRGSKVILFGSYARGQADEDSDLDFLVVEPEVRDRHAEMVRLREVLRPIEASIDVLVYSRNVFEEWQDTPNTVVYEAAKEGKVYEQVA